MDVNFKELKFRCAFCFLIIVLFFSFFTVVQAKEAREVAKGLGDWSLRLESGAKGTTVYKVNASGEDTTARLIKYLGVVLNLTAALGLILMARVLWAGYNWMTAGGDMEKVQGAKKTILHATIGVIIVILIYIIDFFVIDRIIFITGYTK